MIAPTCCPLVPLPTSPVFREEEVEAPPPLTPGVAAVAAVVALLSGDSNQWLILGQHQKIVSGKNRTIFFVSHN